MKLDVLLPLYKPQGNWEKQIIDAITSLRSAFEGTAVIHLYITNDGAPDEYYPVESIQRISDAVDGNFSFLKYEKNRGKGYSLRHLVQHADGDYMVYTDGDFPFGWEAVAECFRELMNGSDVVMGIRNESYGKALTPFRKCLSGGLKLLNTLLCGLPANLQDTQAGIKGFNRTGRESFLRTTVDTFVFDTEFILISWNRKLKITPVKVNLRSGLRLSSMGLKIMFQELKCFAGVLWQVRIKKSYRK
ncbi:MAG: glycosyltransferase [Lentisphaeria bacterium]|nr:glycosyltransferase [Lentisphaeria bacterium]